MINHSLSWTAGGAQVEKLGGITGQPRVELKSGEGSGWEAGDLMVKLKSREGSDWEAGGSLVNHGLSWKAGRAQVEKLGT